MTIGRQQTEQSSTCCCASTDRSTAISIASQQYGQVIVSNWIKRRLAIALRLQALPIPAARLETVRIARVEAAVVANSLMKTVLAFHPELDGVEPQSASAPELRARQIVAGLARDDVDRTFFESGGVQQRAALLAAPSVDLARQRTAREVAVALGRRRAHDRSFEANLPSELVPVE